MNMATMQPQSVFYAPFEYLQLISLDGNSAMGKIYIRNQNHFKISFRILVPTSLRILVNPQCGNIGKTQIRCVKVTLTPSNMIIDQDYFKRNYQLLIQVMKFDETMFTQSPTFQKTESLIDLIKMWNTRLKAQGNFPLPRVCLNKLTQIYKRNAKTLTEHSRRNYKKYTTNLTIKERGETSTEGFSANPVTDENFTADFSSAVTIAKATKPNKIEIEVENENLLKSIPNHINPSNSDENNFDSQKYMAYGKIIHTESSDNSKSKPNINAVENLQTPNDMINSNSSINLNDFQSKKNSSGMTDANDPTNSTDITNASFFKKKNNIRYKEDIKLDNAIRNVLDANIKPNSYKEMMDNISENESKMKECPMVLVRFKNKKKNDRLKCQSSSLNTRKYQYSNNNEPYIVKVISKSCDKTIAQSERNERPDSELCEILLDLLQEMNTPKPPIRKSLPNQQTPKPKSTNSLKKSKVACQPKNVYVVKTDDLNFISFGSLNNLPDLPESQINNQQIDIDKKKPSDLKDTLEIISDSELDNKTFKEMRSNLIPDPDAAALITLERGYRFLMESKKRNPYSTNPVTMTRNYSYSPPGLNFHPNLVKCSFDECNIFELDYGYLHNNPTIKGFVVKRFDKQDNGYTINNAPAKMSKIPKPYIESEFQTANNPPNEINMSMSNPGLN